MSNSLNKRFIKMQFRLTMNCRASGQADLLKRLTAIRLWFSIFPLYTTFGAFSPCSETMFSTANPDVAILSCSIENSRNEGKSLISLFSSFSAKSVKKYQIWLFSKSKEKEGTRVIGQTSIFGFINWSITLRDKTTQGEFRIATAHPNRTV